MMSRTQRPLGRRPKPKTLRPSIGPSAMGAIMDNANIGAERAVARYSCKRQRRASAASDARMASVSVANGRTGVARKPTAAAALMTARSTAARGSRVTVIVGHLQSAASTPGTRAGKAAARARPSEEPLPSPPSSTTEASTSCEVTGVGGALASGFVAEVADIFADVLDGPSLTTEASKPRSSTSRAKAAASRAGCEAAPPIPSAPPRSYRTSARPANSATETPFTPATRCKPPVTVDEQAAHVIPPTVITAV